MNSFLIEIFNTAKETIPVELFTDKPLNKNIRVESYKSMFNYEQLLMIARTENFSGNWLQSDADRLKIIIHNNSKDVTAEKYLRDFDIRCNFHHQ